MSRTPGTTEATSTKASISSVLEAPDRVTRPALELTWTRATSPRSARRRSAAARWLVRLVVDADLLGDALRVVASQALHHACLSQLEGRAHTRTHTTCGISRSRCVAPQPRMMAPPLLVHEAAMP